MRRTEFALLVASSALVLALPTIARSDDPSHPDKTKPHKGGGSSDPQSSGAVTAIPEHDTTFTVTSDDVAEEYWPDYFPQGVKMGIQLNSVGQYHLTASAPAQPKLINYANMIIGVGIKSPNGSLLIFEHELRFHPGIAATSVDIVREVQIIKEFWPEILPGHSWAFVNTVTTMSPVDKTVLEKTLPVPTPSASATAASGFHPVEFHGGPVQMVVSPITGAQISADILDVQNKLYKQLKSSASSLIQAPFITLAESS
jgi:hypothetical protein